MSVNEPVPSFDPADDADQPDSSDQLVTHADLKALTSEVRDIFDQDRQREQEARADGDWQQEFDAVHQALVGFRQKHNIPDDVHERLKADVMEFGIDVEQAEGLTGFVRAYGKLAIGYLRDRDKNKSSEETPPETPPANSTSPEAAGPDSAQCEQTLSDTPGKLLQFLNGALPHTSSIKGVLEP